MTVPIASFSATVLASPSPLTPRPSVASLQPMKTPVLTFIAETPGSKHSPRRIPLDSVMDSNIDLIEVQESGGNGNDSLLSDGRQTPTPGSEASIQSKFSLPSMSTSKEPHTNASTSTPSCNKAVADVSKLLVVVGFGPQADEDQLKSSLKTSDRFFLVRVSKEIEMFLEKVQAGTAEQVIPPNLIATTSTSSVVFTSSFDLKVAPASSFQRMLVYKTASWYGLKAVSGPDSQLVIGVHGDLDEKSHSLRLLTFSPSPDAPPSPPQKSIMRRAPGNAIPRSRSVAAESTSSEGGPSRYLTLEEREMAYALAKQRIFAENAQNEAEAALKADSRPQTGSALQKIRGKGGDDETNSSSKSETGTIRGRSMRQADTNTPEAFINYPMIDPALPLSIHPEPQMEPQYPTLFNPPQQSYPDLRYPPGVASETSYGYSQRLHYPPYNHTNGSLASNQQRNMYGNGNHSPSHLPLHPQYPPMSQRYMDHDPNAYYGPSMNYPQQWHPDIPTQNYPASMPLVPPVSQGPMLMMNPSWGYQATGNPMMPPIQQSPMVPQALQYQSSYGYHPPPPPPQPSHSYNNLVQPTPFRPGPYPHSSTSSSMSSRSFQDGSRPHSRGSTTSTRSAASSVRLGAMYPANQGAYRQKGMKAAQMNGFTTLGTKMERKSTRGNSPASATTSSSRSSRHNGSIGVTEPQPGQHQLPQRPDWAANNVPYRPLPYAIEGQFANRPHDFPPLSSNGHSVHYSQGMMAEPMQVERMKSRAAPNGGVWNKESTSGTGVLPNGISSQNATQVFSAVPLTGAQLNGDSPEDLGRSDTPGPTPLHSNTRQASSDSHAHSPEDPDFPPRGRTASQALFNPREDSSAANHQSTKPVEVEQFGQSNEDSIEKSTGPSTEMSIEDAIEAKLAAVSLREGVSIGPPPARNQMNGSGSSASYAKIVKRD